MMRESTPVARAIGVLGVLGVPATVWRCATPEQVAPRKPIEQIGIMTRNRDREQHGPLAPYHDFHDPISRCRHWGAFTPQTARSREELDPRNDAEFDRLVFAGTIREAERGYFYLHGVPEDTDGRLLLKHPVMLIALCILLGAAVLYGVHSIAR